VARILREFCVCVSLDRGQQSALAGDGGYYLCEGILVEVNLFEIGRDVRQQYDIARDDANRRVRRIDHIEITVFGDGGVSIGELQNRLSNQARLQQQCDAIIRGRDSEIGALPGDGRIDITHVREQQIKRGNVLLTFEHAQIQPRQAVVITEDVAAIQRRGGEVKDIHEIRKR